MRIRGRMFMVFLLSFCVLFSGLGYASLTDELVISGKATIDFPSGLFITATEFDSQSNLNSQSMTHIAYSTTVNCVLNRASGGAGTASYTVTVYNNTDRVYAYRGLYYQTKQDNGFDDTYEGNNHISTSPANNKISIEVDFGGGTTIIQPHTALSFTVTYTVGRNLDADKDWNTLVNLQFGINVDSAEEALEAVSEKFENILNTASTYAEIVDKIDDKYDGRAWTATYFGNVTGSSDADSMTINTLFAGQLNLLINGVEQPVTVIIKRENIDGDALTGDDWTVTNGTNTASGTGCEYTLYMTTDELTTYNAYPTIYAMVYTCDRDADGNLGSWYMIGQRYEGTAQVVGYVGGTSGGSFDTGSWRSRSQTLSPAESYSYTVSGNQTINTIITARDSAANSAMQTLLDEAYRILTENKYAGAGMVDLENAYADSAAIYDLDAGNAPVVKDATRSQLVPHIQRMEDALRMFQISELDALAKLAYNILSGTAGTQAEREALQNAYDAAKAAGLFTDNGGLIVVNGDASYSAFKTHVTALSAAYAPFQA